MKEDFTLEDGDVVVTFKVIGDDKFKPFEIDKNIIAMMTDGSPEQIIDFCFAETKRSLLEDVEDHPSANHDTPQQ